MITREEFEKEILVAKLNGTYVYSDERVVVSVGAISDTPIDWGWESWVHDRGLFTVSHVWNKFGINVKFTDEALPDNYYFYGNGYYFNPRESWLGYISDTQNPKIYALGLHVTQLTIDVNFLSALPFSGATQLANLYNAYNGNYASKPSPLMSLLANSEQAIMNSPAWIANPDEQVIHNTSRGLIDHFWEHTGANMILDRNDFWPACIPTLIKLYPESKVVVLVDSISTILAKFVYLMGLQGNQNLPAITQQIYEHHIMPVMNAIRIGYESYPEMMQIMEWDFLTCSSARTSIPGLAYIGGIPTQPSQEECAEYGFPGKHIPDDLNPMQILGEQLYNNINDMKLEFWR